MTHRKTTHARSVGTRKPRDPHTLRYLSNYEQALLRDSTPGPAVKHARANSQLDDAELAKLRSRIRMRSYKALGLLH